MKEPVSPGSPEALRTFCELAARQILGLELRLRTLVAEAERANQLEVLEEAVGSSLRLAQRLLDAGRNGQHDTLLALRPVLRALSAARR